MLLHVKNLAEVCSFIFTFGCFLPLVDWFCSESPLLPPLKDRKNNTNINSENNVSNFG